MDFPNTRPYDIDVNELDQTHFLSARLYAPIITVQANHDTIQAMRLKPRLYKDWSNFALSVQPVVKIGADSLPPYKEFEDFLVPFAADYEHAYVRFRNHNLELFVGRERFSIGPSPRYNMLVSGYSAPIDGLHFSWQSKKIKISYYLCQLDDVYDKPLEYINDTINTYITARRYLLVKRLDYSPAEWLKIGLSESSVFGGENFIPNLYHLNPVVFLQAYQYNWAEDINFFLGFDVKLFLPNIAMYTSLLLDDFQLEADPNNEPNHWGVNLGIEVADLLGWDKAFWRAEYTRLSRYMYCHFIPFQRYQHRGTSIGSPYGPGYDEIFAKLTYHAHEIFDVYMYGKYMRKGETCVSSIWPIPENPRQPGTSFPDNNFLSGTIETSVDLGIGLSFFHVPYLALDGSVGFLHEQNADYVLDRVENTIVFCLQLSGPAL